MTEFKKLTAYSDAKCEWVSPTYPYDEENAQLKAENAKLRALCRDMYLVVELLDMDGTRLQAHGKDADWRTLKERFEELMGIGVDE